MISFGMVWEIDMVRLGETGLEGDTQQTPRATGRGPRTDDQRDGFWIAGDAYLMSWPEQQVSAKSAAALIGIGGPCSLFVLALAYPPFLPFIFAFPTFALLIFALSNFAHHAYHENEVKSFLIAFMHLHTCMGPFHNSTGSADWNNRGCTALERSLPMWKCSGTSHQLHPDRIVPRLLPLATAYSASDSPPCTGLPVAELRCVPWLAHTPLILARLAHL